MVLHLYKLESIVIYVFSLFGQSFPFKTCMTRYLNIGPVVPEKFLKIISLYFQYFTITCICSLKWAWLFVWTKNQFPLPKDDLCRVWLKLAMCVVLKKMKSLQTERQWERQQAIRKTWLSFQLRWAVKFWVFPYKRERALSMLPVLVR